MYKFICLLILFSCTSLSTEHFKYFEHHYQLSDKSGSFILQRKGQLKKGQLIIKSTIVEGDRVDPILDNSAEGELDKLDDQRSENAQLISAEPKGDPIVLEKSITISKLTSSSKLSPYLSETIVYLDGERYKSKMQLTDRRLEISYTDKQEKSEVLTLDPGVACFYSHLIECLYFNNLLDRVLKKESVSVQLIVDSYPYFFDQYLLNNKQAVFKAQVSFIEKIDQLDRLALLFDNQSILYQIDRNHQLVNIFWIAQGLTVSRK